MARSIPGVGEALAFVQGNPVYQSVIQISDDAEKIIDTAPIIADQIDKVVQPLVEKSAKSIGTYKDSALIKGKSQRL
jgi:hypothetical protein